MSKSNSKVWQLTPEISKHIDLFLEEVYPDSEKMGEKMTKREANLEISQVRGLENLTVSTSRFSEIINYIKSQAGKGTKGKGWNVFAEDLLLKLKEIERKAWEIGSNDPEAALEIKLRLTRGWVKQVVSHYLYEKSREKGENNE